MSNSAGVSPMMAEVSAYISGTCERPLPDEIVERAKMHLVDTFAAIMAGVALEAGRRIIPYVRRLGGTPDAGVIGTSLVTTALSAALANGTCGHADETDDTHPPTRTHPGTSVVPAVLAVGEMAGSSGRDVLRALITGYELNGRTMMALDHRKLYPTGRQPAATGQVFGAVAAAAALLRLSERQVRYALSYALQHASGVQTMFRDIEHVEKAVAMGGLPAHNGVQAALMAAAGFTGVEDVYAGEPNLFTVLSPGAVPGQLTAGLGETYEITRCGIKRWPVGGPIQAAMQAAYELLHEHGVSADEVDQITVGLPFELLQVVDNREMTDISLQHLLAVMIVDGDLTFSSAHDTARVSDQSVAAMRDRIVAVEDASIPNQVRGWRARLTVHTRDGRTVQHEVLAAKGSWENPIERPEIAAKALDLMAPVVGPQRAQALIDQLLEIEKLADIRELRPYYEASGNF